MTSIAQKNISAMDYVHAITYPIHTTGFQKPNLAQILEGGGSSFSAKTGQIPAGFPSFLFSKFIFLKFCRFEIEVETISN